MLAKEEKKSILPRTLPHDIGNINFKMRHTQEITTLLLIFPSPTPPPPKKKEKKK